MYLQKGELQKGGCNSKERISPWCGPLQASQGQGDEQITWPSPLYQSTERKEGSKKTYYTKDELWTTDNNNCTQQQLRVFYTFTLLLIHLVRKFGFPACLCKLVNPHTRLPVGMYASCRNVRTCCIYMSQPVEVHASSTACLLSE